MDLVENKGSPAAGGATTEGAPSGVFLLWRNSYPGHVMPGQDKHIAQNTLLGWGDPADLGGNIHLISGS